MSNKISYLLLDSGITMFFVSTGAMDGSDAGLGFIVLTTGMGIG